MSVVNGGVGSNFCAQLLLKATLAAAGGTSTNVQSTFFYVRPPGGGVISKTALSAAFLAGPYAAMLAAFNVGYANGSSNIRFIDDAQNADTVTSLAGTGAIATDRASSFNAVYMQFRTGLRGRTFNGSKHFPAVNEIDSTGDILTGAGLVRWQAVQTAVIAPLVDANGITWNPSVISFKNSTIKTNPTTVVYNTITQVVLDLTLGTMKGRKVKTVI